MNWSDAKEIDEIVRRVAPVIMSTVPPAGGDDAAKARQAIGVLMASDKTDYPLFVSLFMDALDLARKAGATLAAMGRIRRAALAETPSSTSAVSVVLAMIRLTLSQEARLVVALTFRSRDDVTVVSDDIVGAFTAAAEVASDDLDASVYIAIVTLQADVIKFLTDQARLLPRVISYEFQRPMPSLTMAQRVYSDATRAQDLVDENKVVHPAFMPRTGRLLAV